MEYFDIEFVLPEPASARTIERLFEAAFDAGCHTEKDGGNDQCRYKSPNTEGYGSEEGPTSDAIAEIADGGHGEILLWYGEYDDKLSTLGFRLKVYRDAGELAVKKTASSEDTPRVVITVDAVNVNSRKAPTEVLEAKSADLVELAKTFYPILQPVHVVGYRVWDVPVSYEPPVGPLETHGVTIDEALDWMAIFTPETVERIGTDWLDAVDVYRHERLEDGSLLVVLTPRPSDPGEIDEKLDDLGSLIDFSE